MNKESLFRDLVTQQLERDKKIDADKEKTPVWNVAGIEGFYCLATPLYSCSGCNKIRYVGKSYMCCSICRMVYYCSSECQKNHWKEHKEICNKDMIDKAELLSRFVSAIAKDHSDIMMFLIKRLMLQLDISSKGCIVTISESDILWMLKMNTGLLRYNVSPLALSDCIMDPPRIDTNLKIRIQLKDEPIYRDLIVIFSCSPEELPILWKKSNSFHIKFEICTIVVFAVWVAILLAIFYYILLFLYRIVI